MINDPIDRTNTERILDRKKKKKSAKKAKKNINDDLLTLERERNNTLQLENYALKNQIQHLKTAIKTFTDALKALVAESVKL